MSFLSSNLANSKSSLPAFLNSAMSLLISAMSLLISAMSLLVASFNSAMSPLGRLLQLRNVPFGRQMGLDQSVLQPHDGFRMLIGHTRLFQIVQGIQHIKGTVPTIFDLFRTVSILHIFLLSFFCKTTPVVQGQSCHATINVPRLPLPGTGGGTGRLPFFQRSLTKNISPPV